MLPVQVQGGLWRASGGVFRCKGMDGADGLSLQADLPGGCLANHLIKIVAK